VDTFCHNMNVGNFDFLSESEGNFELLSTIAPHSDCFFLSLFLHVVFPNANS
jgi:hypothetical protein